VKTAGLLGDTPVRDYSEKLRRFNRFAEPELCELISGLGLKAGMQALDVGCGTGEALVWLQRAVGPQGAVSGVDLSAAHVAAARQAAPMARIYHADVLELPVSDASYDLAWCVNTINHFKAPLAALARLHSLLRPGGRIALGQSSFLPDMYFCWDARLERLTNEAVRQYYRERYFLEERDLTAVRRLVGMLRDSKFGAVTARTVVLERVAPLDQASERYVAETMFRDSWGERLRPYMTAADFCTLQEYCDPGAPGYALRRPDFHFIQVFTLAVGRRDAV
jgi:ubiquinone/menaquinone biosynthesis C-methylase UbiE